ncbi:LamG-like jellyroll fold domain-containing protein [Cellulomonas iranensis]|uniref:LamG-like jellyroll fold domain-containing protein n=1 Tax=Cellulomonas iranensis TaxID=76862 RepID=UPI003D7C8061
MSFPRPAGALRLAAVTALTVGLALVPGAAQAHGRNHAPDRPAALTTSPPGAACTTGAVLPVVRSLTPTLRATLVDADGDAVRATFTLRDGTSGRKLWSPPATAPQASGAEHAVEVPAGLLVDGRTYEWRVQAKDEHGRKSPTVRCRVVVDVTAPGETSVTAVPGAGAVYGEDATSGGVGVAGAFRLEAADADVVAFRYGFDGGQATVAVEPGTTAATVTFTPATAGPVALVAAAVDRAGNVGPERLYRFTVASASSAPVGNAQWLLDEGEGGTAADALGGPDLVLTPSTTWTGGVLADLGWLDDDSALLLDEDGDGAATPGPVVDATGSFTVAAFVRADGTTPGTVLSQDGGTASGFTLGTGATACTDDAALCWAFTVQDAAGGAAVATATIPVTPGSWYGVFGVRDAATGTVRVDVCEIGTADEPGSMAPQTGTPVGLASAPAASGPFRVGGTPDGASSWRGAVSAVHTWGAAVDVMRERVLCTRGGA